MWIDDWYSPEMLEKEAAYNGASQDVNGTKACDRRTKQEQPCSNFGQTGLADELVRSDNICKASSESGLHDAQLTREGSVWEMLSSEETLEGIAELPSVEDAIYALQKCRKKKVLADAKLVYTHIRNNGLESHRAIGNYIVPMFVECGSLSDAQKVFDKLTHRNVYSWTSLMLGYIQCGEAQHALSLYQKMQEDNVHPSSSTLITVLKACARLKNVETGRGVHTEIAQKGFEKDIFLSSTLVDMYAKCGSLLEARAILDTLPIRDVVSWTSLIAGYAEHGPHQEALKCFEQMHVECISPNGITLIYVLKACGSMRAIGKGRKLHALIAQKGFERDLYISSTLVDMYAKCGSLLEAREVFDKLPVQDVVSWNALIAGYTEHGPYQEVLNSFERMQLKKVPPDAVTFTFVLKACGSMGAIIKGWEIHAEIIRKGFGEDFTVGNTLVDMYAKCASLSEARGVFDKLPVRSIVSWNALIAGYAEHGPDEEVLECFEQMQLDSISPDAITFSSILKACGRVGAISKGREIHMEIPKKILEKELFVSNTLIDMYAKCGLLSEAQSVFEKLPIRDAVSWNALIAGYAEHGAGHEAVKCFEKMQMDGVSSDAITFSCVLKACGSMGAIGKGREIHAVISHQGFENDLSVGSTLVDMYVQCGSISEAHKVLDKIPVRNVVSWSAIIRGYGMIHEGDMFVQCFEDMQQDGVKPDSILCSSLLTACSQTNLVFKGHKYFELMGKKYHIAPEHYTCVADLLARSGHLYEAEEFLETMWLPPSEETWTAVLSACKTYGEAGLGLNCFKQLIRMNPGSAASYMLMKNIYGSAGQWNDVYRIEVLRKHAGAK